MGNLVQLLPMIISFPSLTLSSRSNHLCLTILTKLRKSMKIGLSHIANLIFLPVYLLDKLLKPEQSGWPDK